MEFPGQEPIIVGSAVRAPTASVAAIRGSFFQNLDPRLAGLMLVSMLIHGGVVAYLYRVPTPKREAMELEKIPERFAKFIIDKPLPKKEQAGRAKGEGGQKSSKTAETAKAEPAKGTEVDPAVQAKRVAQAQKSVAKRAQRAEAMLRNSGVLGMLSGLGATGKGPAVVDVLGRAGRVSAATDLESQLQGVTGLTSAATAMNQPLVRSREGVGTAQKADISDLIMGLEGARASSLAHRGEIQWYKPPEIVGQASSSAKRAQEAINRVVKDKLTTIKVTYERILKLNPNLSGKLTVRFTIEEDGSVSNVEIIETTVNSPELEREIIRKVERWIFEPLASGSGTTVVTYPFIFQSK